MPIGFVHTWWYHLNSVASKLYYHSNGFRGSIDLPVKSHTYMYVYMMFVLIEKWEIIHILYMYMYKRYCHQTVITNVD